MHVNASTLPPPRNILLASDLHAHGDRALDRAAQLARQWRVPLHVVYVQAGDGCDLISPMPLSWRHESAPAAWVERKIRRNLGHDVGELVVHVGEGEPADVILDTAASLGCDLIVLGGAESTAPGAPGRVTEQLLRRSPVSLLVVKNRPRGAYAHAVVGTDFTSESRDGLTAAAGWFPAARLALVHVLDIPYTSLWLDEGGGEALARMEMATMQAFLSSAPLAEEARARVVALVEHGHPEIVLRDYALREDADLVVIGAFRRGLAFHVLVGGTSRRIVPAMPADVLLVRAQAD